MVTTTRTSSVLSIIARPNLSATWRTNLLLLVLLAVPSLGVAIAFALAGAWPILPLAGLELSALAGALYYTHWKLQYRHVITVSDTHVCIEKGHYTPNRHWNFARRESGLTVIRESHPWGAPELSLQSRGESVSIGEFLNREDCLKLMAVLGDEVQVHADATEVERCF